MEILFCNTLLEVKMIYYVKIALNFIKFAIPIMLILKISLDVYKSILNDDEKDNVFKHAPKRIIAAVIVFLVPTFIDVLISFIGNVGNNKSFHDSFTACYASSNLELVEQLETMQDAINTTEDEKAKWQAQVDKAKYEAYLQSARENANKVNSTTGEYKSDLTDTKKQNGVYVENGVFYKPQYKRGDSSTYSGKNCPSNPESEGYNNKYGFNNYFWTMLQNLIEGAKKAGFNLGFYEEGCRSYSTQESFYKKYEKGRAAVPGRSNHGWGIAADVKFYVNSSKKCGGSRTRSNCPGMAWVHDNAKNYGLHFPLLHASYKEDWHIEPIHLKTY